MQEAAPVALRAVRVIQQEFIQAQAAMTQQVLAVQEEHLRVQQSLLAQLSSAADAYHLRKIALKGSPGGRMISRHGCWNAKPARCSVISLSDAIAIQNAFIAKGSEQWYMRGDWPGGHIVGQEYKQCLDCALPLAACRFDGRNDQGDLTPPCAADSVLPISSGGLCAGWPSL